MNFAFAVFLFVIGAIIAATFIYYLIGIVSPIFVSMNPNATFRNTANQIVNQGNTLGAQSILVMLVLMVFVGSLVDLYVGAKNPNAIIGLINIFLVIVAVGVWLVSNRFIFNEISIPLLTSPVSPLYSLFSSTWFISVVGIVLLISAGLHLGGEGKR